MVRHTSTIVAVPSPADTQLSPMGVAWSTNALIACFLRMESQEPPGRHGPIVLRCPGNGPETPSLGTQKGETRTGTCKNRTRVKPSTRVLRPTPIATPTSARDGPHVGTHVCTPLKLYLLFPDSWSPLGLGKCLRAMARWGRRLPDLGISAPLGRCMHIGVGARRDRFSTIDKRGRRRLREPAHGLGE